MAKTMVKTIAPNWENRTLFHKDNLDVLREMNSETVDLIATDPPFNKGRDFHAVPDSLADGASFQDRWSWEHDVHQDWIDKLEDDWADVAKIITLTRYGYGEDMAAYLCFMAVRLIEMHRVLKPTGSLYLHCDATACHYLKILLDAIFGKKNFRNEIIWNSTNSPKSQSKTFGAQSETVYLYSKTDEFTFNKTYRPHDEKSIKPYSYDDKDGKGKYRLIEIEAQGTQKYKGRKEFKFLDRTAPYLYSLEKLNKWNEEGIIYTSKNGRYSKKQYLEDTPGVVVSNIWIDGDVPPIQSAESTGYPTQKPLPLYQRMIKASSNKGDIVLDPFCGCATTLVAAEVAGRQWVGIDIWDEAHKIVIKRLEDSGLLKNESGAAKSTFSFGDFHYTKELPERTDDKKESVPFLRIKETVDEPKDIKRSRAEMVIYLIKQNGCKCQGCNRVFDDSRYLELDHGQPRSDGGLNHISNRILLCGPCNKLKSNTLTLTGLRNKNKKEGYMQDEA